MIDGYWLPVTSQDPRAIALYMRHYSSEKRRGHHGYSNRVDFIGPGERMVLLTQQCDALFAWHSCLVYPDLGGQSGLMCSIFRNESPIRSSDLIREACALAWQRWPGKRLFTYVDDGKIRSTNPGACFKKAGWRRCGRNADGRLTILEMFPTEAAVA